MKTKLRSRRFKIILCTLLLLLLFLAICFCVPFLRHRILRVPIKTDTLFPRPDRIVCHDNGKSYRFSKKQTALLYERFLADEVTGFTIEEYAKSINDKEASFWWEFKYYDAYQHTLTTPGNETITYVFTKLSMQHASGGLALSRTYMGLSFKSLTGKNLLCKDRYTAQLTNSMSQMIVADIMDTYVWEIENETPTVNNYFAAMPDEIYIYNDGRSQTITQESEISYIYSLFEDIFMQSSVSYLPDRFVAKSTDFIDKIPQNICIEFRYKQRQEYINSKITADDAKDWGSYTVQEFYNKHKYDKLLFTFNETDTQLWCAVGIGYTTGYSAALDHAWYPPTAALSALILYVEDLP